MAGKDFLILCKTIFDNYLSERKLPFEKNWLAELIRHDLTQSLAEMISLNEQEFTKASPGTGGWTFVPWAAILNKFETTTPQEGVYVVYLFSEDMQRLYLTLNQGVTNQKTTKGRPKALEWLRLKADDIALHYPSSEFKKGDSLMLGESDTAVEYEKACIYYKEYKKESLPSKDDLIKDLIAITNFYRKYVSDSNADIAGTPYLDYPKGVPEGKEAWRKHLVRDRDSTIIPKIKQLRLKEFGELRCEVCGFSFKEKYGSLGGDFIEGHHKIGVSKMKEGHITKPEDIALVCSNCHSMIHREDLTVEELRSHIKRRD